MNCTEIRTVLDAAFYHVDNGVQDEQILLPLVAGVGGFIILVWGFAIIRTVSAMVAAVSLAWLAYSATSNIGCETQLAIMGISALVGGSIALCLLHKALFLSGCAAFGVTAYFVASALPTFGLVVWQGKSILYWGVVTFSTILGGVIVHYRREETLLLVCAAIGSAGIVFAVSLITDAPEWTLMILFLSLMGGGALVQKELKARFRVQVSSSPEA